MTASAPPQTPSAIATREDNTGVEVAQDMRVRSIAGREDLSLERFETVVTIPPDFQYAIPIKGVKIPGTQEWDNSKAKVGLTIDAYDYLNRVVGATFFFPDKVHDEKGQEQPNPIHRRDYIYLRMGCVWYTPLGQLIMAIEDVEVDFGALYMDKRANAKSAVVVTSEQGGPLWDDAGNPVIKLDAADELKVIRELTRMRSFGPRYAVTVARVRLLKQATGIRSLPLNAVGAFQIRVVGYRDKMNPQERVHKAGGDLSTLYGRPADIEPLSAAETEEIDMANADEGEEEQDRQHVVENIARQAEQAPPNAEPVAPAAPGTLPWTPDELAGIEDLGPTRPPE